MKLKLHFDFVQLLISRTLEVDIWKKKKEEKKADKVHCRLSYINRDYFSW